MKRIILLALIVLGMISCKKKEDVEPKKVDPQTTSPVYVAPDTTITPTYVIPETNHVLITVHSIQALDSIVIVYDGGGSLVRAVRDGNDIYYLCNLVDNAAGVTSVNSCYDGYVELIAAWNIEIVYSGDVTVEYLYSTL